MATVGTVIIDVKADTAKLISGMDKAEKSIKKTVSGIQTAIISMATAYVGIQGVKAFTHMINDSIDAADATGKLAQKLGLTTDALSEYQYAAGFAAVSNGELNAGLSALIRRLNNFERTGGGAAKQAFLELGISSEYARKHFTSTDIAFKEILKRLEKMPDGFKKTAIAQDIFSKSASGIMRITATDLKKFSDEAKKIGISIPQSAYEMAAAYHDQMDQLESRMKGMKQTVSLSLISPMNAASQTAVEMYDAMFVDSVAKIDNFQNSASNAIINIVNAVGFLKDSFTGIQIVIKSLELVFYGLASAISKALETPMNAINNMVTAYNALAKKMHLDTIDFKLVSSYEDNINEVKNIASEISKLSSTISDGRNFAKKFESQYLSTLEKIKSKTKEVSQTNSDASDIVIAKSEAELKAIEKVNKAKSKQEVNNVFSIINSETSANQGLYDEALLKITPEIDIVNEKFKSLHEVIKDVFNPDQLKAFYQVWGDEASKAKEAAVIEPITIDFRMKGFDDISNAMAGVGNSFMDLSTHSSQFAKDMKKAGKSSEQQEDAMMKYGVASLGTFSNMTGAMASFYDEDDDRRKKQLELSKVINAAQMAMQMALLPGQISAAIAQSGAMAGIPGVIAMVAMLGSLGIMAMGSGGSDNVTQVNQYQARLDDMDAVNEPMLDKMDAQIDLLETIAKNGSSSQANLEKSAKEFIIDMQKLSLTTAKDVGFRVMDSSTNSYKKISSKIDELDELKQSLKSYGISMSNFYSTDNGDEDLYYSLSSMIDTSDELISYIINRDEIDKLSSEQLLSDSEFKSLFDSVQTIVYDFTSSIGDSISDLVDLKDTFEDIFDSITDTATYYNKNIIESQKEVNNLLNGSSLNGYLSKIIRNIKELEKTYNGDAQRLLLSDSPNDLRDQIKLVNSLEKITGKVFENGARDALDFLDSIELVGEALSTSNENMKTFSDGFKSNNQLALEMANNLGVSLATNMKELSLLFEELSSDQIGLTDSELDFLQANKDLIESNTSSVEDLSSQLNTLIGTVRTVVNTLNSTLSKIQDSRDSIALSGSSAREQEFYLLKNYRKSLSDFQTSQSEFFSNPTDIEASSKYTSSRDSLLKTINTYSNLIDKNNLDKTNLNGMDDTLGDIYSATTVEQQIMASQLQELKDIQANTLNQNKQMLAINSNIAEQLKLQIQEIKAAKDAVTPAEFSFDKSLSGVASKDGFRFTDLPDFVLKMANGDVIRREYSTLEEAIEGIKKLEMMYPTEFFYNKANELIDVYQKMSNVTDSYFDISSMKFNLVGSEVYEMMQNLGKSVEQSNLAASYAESLAWTNAKKTGQLSEAQTNFLNQGRIYSAYSYDNRLLQVGDNYINSFMNELGDMLGSLVGVGNTTVNMDDTWYRYINSLNNGSARYPSYDVGTSYVPEDQLAQVHQGEAILPIEHANLYRQNGLNSGDNKLLEEMKNQNKLIEQQANEIRTMRKEIQDQTVILDEIAEVS